MRKSARLNRFHNSEQKSGTGTAKTPRILQDKSGEGPSTVPSVAKDFPPPLWQSSYPELSNDDIKFPIPQVQSESFAPFPHDPVFHSTGSGPNRRLNLTSKFNKYIAAIPDLLYETSIDFSSEFG